MGQITQNMSLAIQLKPMKERKKKQKKRNTEKGSNALVAEPVKGSGSCEPYTC